MKIRAEIERLKSKLDQISDEEVLKSIQELMDSYKVKGNLASEPEATYKKRSDILNIALKLSPSERADLAQQLLDSLDQLEMENEWLELAEKRLSELETGKVKSVSWQTIRNAVSNGA